MRKILIFILVSIPCYLHAQKKIIPKRTSIILVKYVSFIDACNKLLDLNYSIEKKDNELQTAETTSRPYSKSWNATYIIKVRIKDSIMSVTGTFTAPPEGTLFKNEPVEYIGMNKSLSKVAFNELNQFALSFNKPVEYKIQ